MTVAFLALVLAGAVLSGATASVAGFGIGSILTPLLAARLGMQVAVAAVAIPHALATALRCWRLRRSIDSTVLRSFGVLSAIGSLIGALLYTRLSSRGLTIALALLLIATSIAALADWASKAHPSSRAAGVLGMASGLFGGLAGNQGGLRAAALIAFSLTPAPFVATSTAVGLMVDAARVPVYVWSAGDGLADWWVPIAVASVGVLVGTLIGERILLGMSPARFRRVVGALIGALGVWLLYQSLAPLRA